MQKSSPPAPTVPLLSTPMINLDASSVGVLFENLPAIISSFGLINQIHGGTIHSAFIFLAMPGEKKSGVVFFTTSNSADLFYANHLKSNFWVDGEYVTVERKLSCEILEHPFCNLAPFPMGATRCLKISNIPVLKRDSIHWPSQNIHQTHIIFKRKA